MTVDLSNVGPGDIVPPLPLYECRQTWCDWRGRDPVVSYWDKNRPGCPNCGGPVRRIAKKEGGGE